MCSCFCFFFFFKQKTAYEMRISDWSSDVCSSDLPPKDDEPGKFVPIAGEASSTLVTSLLDGTGANRVLIFNCDETDKCLDPGFKSFALPASKALRPREIGRASCRERVCQYV